MNAPCIALALVLLAQIPAHPPGASSPASISSTTSISTPTPYTTQVVWESADHEELGVVMFADGRIQSAEGVLPGDSWHWQDRYLYVTLRGRAYVFVPDPDADLGHMKGCYLQLREGEEPQTIYLRAHDSARDRAAVFLWIFPTYDGYRPTRLETQAEAEAFRLAAEHLAPQREHAEETLSHVQAAEREVARARARLSRPKPTKQQRAALRRAEAALSAIPADERAAAIRYQTALRNIARVEYDSIKAGLKADLAKAQAASDEQLRRSLQERRADERTEKERRPDAPADVPRLPEPGQ